MDYKAIIDRWGNGDKDAELLRVAYAELTGMPVKQCGKCHSKWLTAIRKHVYLKEPQLTVRLYRLKPGNHSFAPGAPAIHNNENTSDQEIEMYLRIHPHIRNFLQ